ncbi:putative zinc-binding metallopeptidase [Pelomonas sp. KK5]|uniref:zinc-binding metallopeptidase family protein n=1 Tax=Pelomonas sp. KK5 TaxID=1855730 RepID=UPI00097C87C9|nr:putative zinc-binding metallopeptidase [Pelomonas sp. KK5]
MRMMTCSRCGQRIFFDNTVCEGCGARLGFVPAEMAMASFDDTLADGAWQRLGPGAAHKPCANYGGPLMPVCNWMLPADSAEGLCLSCRTTATIPALDKPGNLQAWTRIEQAKRRLIYGLLALRLPVPSKEDDEQAGLAFDFLEPLAPGESVLTGHAGGRITLNIAEADDATREQMRASMHEPYRTLLGHFRHEIGHYYWDRLVRGRPKWIGEFRRLFGDERADYGAALQRHYEAGPAADWPQRHVSAYASSHPWEDWAECFAHYLHMQDALETAAAWGLRLDRALPEHCEAAPVQPLPLDLGQPLAAQLIEQWLPLSQFVNAMDRGLGARDSYPFVLPAPVVDKLGFIHRLVGTRRSASPARRRAARHTEPAITSPIA